MEDPDEIIDLNMQFMPADIGRKIRIGGTLAPWFVRWPVQLWRWIWRIPPPPTNNGVFVITSVTGTAPRYRDED